MARNKNTPRPPVQVTEVSQHPAPAAGFSFFEKPGLPELALAVAAVVVYAASLGNGFVFFDDDKAILYNKALLNPSFGKFFSGQNLGMYAPFTWLAYWLCHGRVR